MPAIEVLGGQKKLWVAYNLVVTYSPGQFDVFKSFNKMNKNKSVNKVSMAKARSKGSEVCSLGWFWPPFLYYSREIKLVFGVKSGKKSNPETLT